LINKLFIFSIVSLGSLLSQTYRISGKILDYQDKFPISDVNIYIENTNFGTITDLNGNFNLEFNLSNLNNFKLKAKIIGYKQLTIPLDNLEIKFCSGCSIKISELGNIFLINEVIELESIHVHAFENNLSQISDITINGQEFNNNLSTNIAKTLENYPNIGVSSFGSNVSKPVLRGYSGDRFLLTKGGNLLGDLSQTSIDHAISIDMSEINKIQIIRGPKSLIYGSNTIGGVIDAGTYGNPKFRFNNFTTKINLGYQSFNNSTYGNVFFYIPIKDNQINLSLNERRTKSQTSPIGKLRNTNSEISNYKLGYIKYYQNSFIYLMLENYNMKYGIPPSEEGHINGVDIDLLKNTFQINYHSDISLYNFDQFDIYYNYIDYEHSEYESISDFRAVGLAKNTYNTKIELKSSQNIIGSEIDIKKSSSEGFYWTPKANEINISFYGFYEHIFNNFNLLGSYRFGHSSIFPIKPFLNFSNLDDKQVISRFFPFFSSSIGLKVNYNNFQFSSWLMNTMREPTLEELYSDGPHLGTYSYEIGSPVLDIEKIYGIESAIKYNKKSFTLSVITFYNYSPYYYQMTKMGKCEFEYIAGENHPCAGAEYIEWGSGSTGWLYKYKPKGIESLINGLEFGIIYNYKDFKFKYDFSLVRGYNISEKQPLEYINPDKQKFTFKYSQKIIDYNLRLIKVESQNRLGEFESYTPSYFLVDFIFNFNKNNKIITIQLNNIFNELHYNHLSRIKSIMPEPGINLSINYKILI